MIARQDLRLGGLLVAVSMLGGCGYTLGFEPVAGGIRTVAVQVIDNVTFRQRFERDLTRSVARQLNEYSAYRHAKPATADAILRVEIVAIRNSTLVFGRTRPVDEGALDAIVQIRLIERRTGDTLVDTSHRDIAEYRTMIAEDETTARREMVSDLGRAIVLALEGDF